ncbi:hypothetical protein HY468_04310 [Candidatus Roizmanbacteria bacterium]|nr:hypothetical protein [Candidatus Roizmanbacteria bacterium]
MSLKKEMTIAIVLGLILGGVVALMFTRLPQQLLGINSAEISPTPNPTQPPLPSPFLSEEALTIEVVFPEDQALTHEEKMTVSGKTKPGASVVVTSPTDEMVTNAKDDGTFSAEITLSEGANELFITGFINGSEAEKIIVVNYLPNES